MRKSLEQENDELRERVRDLIDERDALKAQANQARVIHTLVEELKRRTQIAEDHANKLKECITSKEINMTETTVYLAWYSFWDSNENHLFGVFRTREAAQTALEKFTHKGVMSKWINEMPVED